MNKIKLPIFVDFAIILIASILMLSGLILSGNWPNSHDGLRYLCHLDQFRDAFNAGILYPRWMPNYYGGFGYPIFIFYQPGYFYFSLFFTFFTDNILLASYASNIAMFFLGGAGVYLFIRKMTGKRLVSLFCSIIFLLTPYVYVNIYVRGDLSELLAMFVTPWPIYCLLILKERISGDRTLMPAVFVLSLTLAALVYCHPFTSMFFYPLFCAIVLALCIELERKHAIKFACAAAVSLLAAVIFSSPYWFTAFQMKKYVDFQAAISGLYSAASNIVYIPQLFARTWGFGGSEPGPVDGMSFQLGLPHFILAIVGFWLNRRNKFYLSIFILYILCIMLMLPVSELLWKNIPLMNFVQFPWRLLSVIAILQIICISGVFKLAESIKNELNVIATISVLILAIIAWNWDMFRFVGFKYDMKEVIKYHRQLRLEKIAVYESFNEFLPKTAAKFQPAAPRGNGPMILVDDPACKIGEYPGSNPHHMLYGISSGKPQTIMINQLYFPGWKIFVGDTQIDDDTLLKNISKDGRIQIEVPAGENIILEAYYDGPPGWYLRNIIVALAFLAMLVALIIENRKIMNRPAG